MADARPAPHTLRHLCVPCNRVTAWRFAGYAHDGSEAAPGKPRAAHYSCRVCGHSVLSLGNIPDSMGLCITVARRRIHTNSRGVEFDDAVAYLFWHIWRLYLNWQPDALSSDPDARPSFLGYASQWLPRRLDRFLGDATGDATQQRVTPKAHSVSDSYDALIESGAAPGDHSVGGGLDETLGSIGGDADDDRRSDLRRILRRRDSR